VRFAVDFFKVLGSSLQIFSFISDSTGKLHNFKEALISNICGDGAINKIKL
jgi:hypothetical protein